MNQSTASNLNTELALDNKVSPDSNVGIMHKVINQLIQLQELTEARLQHEAARPDAPHAQLDESIEKMARSLPDDVSAYFKRIHTRYPLAVVPITAGRACAGCGMNLPISLVHSVKAAKQIGHCPNCARILYTLPDSTPRHSGASMRKDVKNVGVARFSAPELMLPHVQASSPEEMLSLLCESLHEEEFIDNSEALLERAQERESILSTAVDHGLAFPHVRGVEGGGLTLAVATSVKGIRFGGPGRTLSRMFFFMVIPTAASAFYLKLLSGLTQSFRQETPRENLLKAETSKDMWKVLCQATRKTIT